MDIKKHPQSSKKTCGAHSAISGGRQEAAWTLPSALPLASLVPSVDTDGVSVHVKQEASSRCCLVEFSFHLS